MFARDLKTGDIFKVSEDLTVQVKIVCILRNSMVGLKVVDIKTGDTFHLPPIPATLEVAVEGDL